MSKTLLRILIVLLCITATVSIARGSWNAINGVRRPEGSFTGSCDFAMRWAVMKIVTHRENPYRFFTKEDFSPYSKEILKDNKILGLATREYLPVSSAFIVPFLHLSFHNAVNTFLCVQLTLSAVLIIAMFSLYGKRLIYETYLMIAFAFLSSMPFRTTLSIGQFSIISLALLLLAIHFEARGRWMVSGVLLFLSLLKYYLVLPFIFFFFVIEKKWRPLVVCGSIFSILHVWLAHIMKTSALQVVSDAWHMRSKAHAISVDMFSIFNWLKGLFIFNKYYDFVPFFIVFVAFLLTMFSWIKSRSKVDIIGRLSIVSVFTIFSAYHGSIDYICLIFLLFWITTFDDLRIFRFIIGVCVLYFFLLWGVLNKILFFSATQDYIWVINLIVFYTMAACLMRMIYLKGIAEKS